MCEFMAAVAALKRLSLSDISDMESQREVNPSLRDASGIGQAIELCGNPDGALLSAFGSQRCVAIPVEGGRHRSWPYS
jgi:hypothetical protein